MLLHKCPYDDSVHERPERMQLIYDRLKKDGLLEDAVKVHRDRGTLGLELGSPRLNIVMCHSKRSVAIKKSCA